MTNKKELLETVSSYMESHFQKESDNKKASFLFERGLYYLKESYLFLDGAADKNYLTDNDLPEETVKEIFQVSLELRKLYDKLKTKQK